MNEKKTGVLIICPVYAPHAGGGGQYFPLLAQLLKGHVNIGDVAVLTESHPNRPARNVEHGIHIYRLLPQRDSLAQKNRLYAISSFFWTYVLLYFWIPVLMWKHRAGVLHYTRYLRRAFYALTWVLNTVFRWPIILDMRATVENPKCISRLFGCTALISNSMGVYRQMERLGVDKDRHFFVPNPVDLPNPLSEEDVWRVVEELSPQIKRPYLVFVGQLLERKSIIEVLEAFEKFVVQRPEFQLVLVGRNMMGALVERKITSNGNIIYLGTVSRNQALALMQGSELILQPSRIEGIPRVSLEALALGKKVLLPPCAPELIEGNDAFTVAEITPQNIFEAIVRILAAPAVPKYDLSVHDPDQSMKIFKMVYQKVGINI